MESHLDHRVLRLRSSAARQATTKAPTNHTTAASNPTAISTKRLRPPQETVQPGCDVTLPKTADEAIRNPDAPSQPTSTSTDQARKLGRQPLARSNSLRFSSLEAAETTDNSSSTRLLYLDTNAASGC
jgi:hypothetical protein